MPAAAVDQLLLRYRLATCTADAYAGAGFVTVVQDVIIGPVLADVVRSIQTRPRYVVVLDPDPAVVAERAARRRKSGYVDGWQPESSVDELRQTTRRQCERVGGGVLRPRGECVP